MQYLKLDDFKNYQFLGNLKLSPNGKSKAVLVSQASEDNGYHAVIFVDKGNGFCPLTGLKGKVGHFLWLDDENILFSEMRSKADKEKVEKGYELTSYYKININGGEACEAFKIDALVTKLEMLSEDNYLAVTVFDNNRPCLEGKTSEESEKALKELKKEKDYQVVDELPYWFNGRSFTNKKRIRINTYSVQNGLKPVTDKLTDVSGYKLSSCKKYIAYTGDMAPAEIHSIASNLWLVNLETGEEKAVFAEEKQIRTCNFWKEGKVVVSYATGEKYSMQEHGTFYVVDLKTGEGKELLKYDRSTGGAAASDSKFGGGTTDMVVGDKYYFISLDGFHADIYSLDLNSGAMVNETNFKANIDFFDIADGKIVFGAMETNALQELYCLDGGKVTKISNFNTEILKERKISPVEHFTFKDQDGYEIDGWVLKPVDYEEGKKYPAILDIHGGPKSAFCESFFHEMQYWANQNYFVLFCNPRGSDGKGNDFADVRGAYGTFDYDDIMQFVDESLAKYPGIDADKLGVTGGSYGGFMTNWIIGHTNRFKAAATQRSICNWVSFSYVSDIGYYFGTDQMQADPWNNIEKMWWHSPLKYFDKAETPTLVIHSDEDHRCWIPEGYQVFTALKVHGVDTRMCIFHGENHELSRSGKPEHRARRLQEITEWMDKYLK